MARSSLVDLWGPAPGSGIPERRVGRALGSSLVAHALLMALLIWLGFHAARVVEQPPTPPPDLVYLQDPGPGGGGGGNPSPPAPTRLETPRPRPVEPTPVVQPAALPTPIPDPTLNAAVTSLDDLMRSNGLGHVSFGQAGGGTGDGGGRGDGPGLGDGSNGNTGGGPARPGNGCVSPVPIRQPQPTYTPEAMRAKIQGDVEIELVVRKDGTVSNLHVTKSLDPTFGLDESGLSAAGKWMFHPATCKGQPVDMLVTLVLEFRLH